MPFPNFRESKSKNTTASRNSSSFSSSFSSVKTEISNIDEFRGFTIREIQLAEIFAQDMESVLRFANQGLFGIHSLNNEIQKRHEKVHILKNELYVSPNKRRKVQQPDLLKSHQKHLLLTPNNRSLSASNYASSSSSKRRLGVPFTCRNIQISESSLQGAKKLFETELKPSKSNISTPVRPASSIHASTPLNNTFKDFKKFSDIDITPIKELTGIKKEDESTLVNDRFSFGNPLPINVDKWLEEFENERKFLEQRLATVTQRKKILDDLHYLSNHTSVEHRRQRVGVLMSRKLSEKRSSLQELFHGTPGDLADLNSDLFNINPQNAENFNFLIESSVPSAKTEDGALIVPNLKNMIGLPEVEFSFKITPGVEPKLIPKGWIKNHYKWIVWKLASYERMLKKKYDCCLTLENVIQQLKYRYDREIDKTQRSALRRIFEKDDTPQKRLILCVSNIKLLSNKYELELTDGWYSIRTVIDNPISAQIVRQKIKIGTKLITYGADILNCDGCHPLESTDLVCLKINYNSTRRALWHAKLGYQRNPRPFPIQIQTVNPEGGPIGCLKVYIARVYPSKYMEKLENGVVIWRNKRAEEKAENEWQNERQKHMERIHNKIENEFINQCKNVRSSCQEVSMKNEIQTKIQSELNRLKPRNVSSVLKLTVIDATCCDNTGYTFNVWRASENHFQILKEGEVLSVINTFPSKNGELSSIKSTKFILEEKDSRFEQYQRKIVPIGSLLDTDLSLPFNEFDTIGLVVKINVNVNNQEIWLSDHSGRLLLVSVQEGPKTICLFDNIEVRKIISASNLVKKPSSGDIACAAANHYSVFSVYPRNKHLQEGLEIFEKQVSKNVDDLIKICAEQIENFRIRNQHRTTTGCTTDEDMNMSQLTDTDKALSLIDMDKYF